MAQIRDEILLKKFADKLKRIREQHNVSQETFYNETNINIARIESMKANISLSTLSSICKYFNITMSDFLKGM